ncbi:MAG TPA: HIT domain-containing protein [Acidimicrobiales bacterium]|nr:HIT domain-containing protein [Acidimicrobiales bacterium]
MTIDRIWAGWRSTYIESVSDGEGLQLEPDADGRSLFERIYESGEPDEVTHIVWHGERCFAILNAYPYGSGHLMLLPKRKVAMLEHLTDEEYTELWDGVRAAVVAIKTAYRPDGVNVGANLGRGAGAGVPDHLHVHVLPRWVADSNFMTAVAETRVLPEPLDVTWEKLRRTWPGSSPR